MISLSCFHLFFFHQRGTGSTRAELSGVDLRSCRSDAFRTLSSLSLSQKKNKTKKSHQNQTEKNTAEAFLSICWVSTPAAVGFFNPCSPHAALPSAAVRELGPWHPSGSRGLQRAPR